MLHLSYIYIESKKMLRSISPMTTLTTTVGLTLPQITTLILPLPGVTTLLLPVFTITSSPLFLLFTTTLLLHILAITILLLALLFTTTPLLPVPTITILQLTVPCNYPTSCPRVVFHACGINYFYKNYSFSSFLFEKLLMKNYLKN